MKRFIIAVLISGGLLVGSQTSYGCRWGGGDGGGCFGTPPVAVINVDPNQNQFTIGQSIEFDGSSSYPTDGVGGSIIWYTWDFGDGTGCSSSDCSFVEHLYSSNGQYTVTLEVDDDKGCTESNSVEIRVDYDAFGMHVISAEQDSTGNVTVTTTGARYVLSTSGMDMYRRIDPATNSYPENAKKVATLTFDSGTQLDSLSIDSWDSNEAIVDSDKATFKFESDSLFFIQASDCLDYTHTNLVVPAPWNAPLNPVDRGLDRMWTDGNGGSLCAKVSGSPGFNTVDGNNTSINMSAGDIMAHMVFLPKQFDFEGLYGQNARPNVVFLQDANAINYAMDNNNMNTYIAHNFGVFMLWNSIYDGVPGVEHENPILLNSGIMGYRVDPNLANDVNSFIALAHDNGFKVIFYCSCPGSWVDPNNQHQDPNVTLQFMHDFRTQYNFDGWYMDDANAGDFMADYNFIRRLRTDIGDSGIIYHHDSVDVWDPLINWATFNPATYSGLKAVFIDAYVNYAMAGETGDIADVNGPNEKYLRYFSSGYGMSQAYGVHDMKGDCKAAISEAELGHVLGSNLNCVQRCMEEISNGYHWDTYFERYFNLRKTEYAGANFVPDVNWPINNDTGWFRTPGDITVTDITSTSATINWTTTVDANSEVTWTNEIYNGVWWYYTSGGRPYGPDGKVSHSDMVSDHTVTLSNLQPDTTYEFKIRSTNDTNNPPDVSSQIIWGYVGMFTTEPEE